MKHKVKLLRIYFDSHEFSNDDYNKYHYLFHQISLLLLSELDSCLNKDLKSLIVTFGSKEKLLKNFSSLLNLHWHSGGGSADLLFDFTHFFNLNFEQKKKYTLTQACRAISLIAKEGGQNNLFECIQDIHKKYEEMQTITFEYTALTKDFEFNENIFVGEVIFTFNKDIDIPVFFSIKKNGYEISRHEITIFRYGYIEWVITAFKKVQVKGSSLILKGDKDLDELPFKIDISHLKSIS